MRAIKQNYYLPNANLLSPFNGATFGSAQVLQTVTNTNSQLTTTFTTSNSGELTQTTFPYGGNLQWAYGNATFTGRTQREVQTRYLTMSSGGTQLAYPITHPGDSGTSFHSTTTLTDAGGLGSKVWAFDTNADAALGLQFQFDSLHNGTSKSRSNSLWTLDSMNRPYISSVYKTLEPGASNQVQSHTDQAIDQYGNVTIMYLYDYGASSPTRVYTNTYLSDSSPTSVHPAGSNYNAEHIHNRLLTSTVAQNGKTATLANNLYDFYNPQTCNDGTGVMTPYGWQWVNSVTAIDPANSSNIFRGNVTTNYGMDMTHSMCYATTGAVIRSTDGGHISTTQTSSTTNYTAPTAITTGSLTTNLAWDTMLRPTGETGPNGDGVSIGYDSASRPATTTTPNGASITYTYSTSPPQTTATMQTDDPNTTGRKTVTKFDGLGRAIEVDSIDAAGVTRSIVQSQYAPCGCSPMGKLSKTSRPYKPGDPLYWTTYTYDGLGRTLSVVAPDGASTTTYSYAGNTVTTTDPAGNWKKFTMDAFGNLTIVVEPDASQTNTNNQATTNYTHDALNHLTNVSMPRRMPGGNVVTQTRTFNYVFNNSITAYLLSVTNPENGTVTYSYYADGRLASKTDAMGQTLYYPRDTYGRLIQVQHSNPPDFYGNPVPPTTIRTYTWDANPVDPTFSVNSLGRVTTVQYSVPAVSSALDNFGNEVDFTGDTVTEMYSYYGPGQVYAKRLRVTRANSLNETLTADLNGSWTYNNEGRLKGINYPGDPNASPGPASYTYSYDGMGRLAGMTETAPYNLPVLSGVTYNASGQMTQMGSETRSYNIMGQLTNIHSGSLNITYNYSATQNNGKITSQVDNLTGEQVTYAYDSLERLIAAQAGSTWGQGFAYDPFGNLTDKTALAGSVPTLHVVPDASTNHLGGEDANGNPPGSMDAENRLVLSGTMRYAYDAHNKRVWACTATGSAPYPCTSQTYFFYGPDGKLLAQFTPVYTPKDQNNQGQVFPATLTFQASGGRSYFGSRLLGDEDRIGSRGKYFPYGEDRSSQNPPNDTVKFAAYTRDSATGLDYAAEDNSYYTATYGRYLSVLRRGSPTDPTSWNRYRYTGGDPINNVSEAEDDGCEFYDDCEGGGGGGGGDEPVECPQGQHDDGTGVCVADSPTGGGLGPWDYVNTTTKNMRAALANKLNSLAGSNCMQVLNQTFGDSIADLLFLAGNITYFNTSGPAGQLTIRDVQPGGTYPPSIANQTLQVTLLLAAQQFGTVALTLPVASTVSAFKGSLPEVLLLGDVPDPQLLWHEFWHAGLNMDDEQIVNRFQIQVNPGEKASQAFNRWLNDKDCGAKP